MSPPPGCCPHSPSRWACPAASLTGTFFAVGIACINSIANVGGFIGPYVVGALKGATGSIDASMLFLAAVLIYAAVMALIAKRIYEPRGSTPVAEQARPSVTS